MFLEDFNDELVEKTHNPANNGLLSEAMVLLGLGPNGNPLNRVLAAQLTDQQRQIAGLFGPQGLANRQFQVRQEAYRQLQAFGPLAIEPLIAHVDNPDLEVARRSERLLESQLSQSDDNFIADRMATESMPLRALLRQEIISNRLTVFDERDLHRRFRGLIANRDDPFSEENVRRLEETFQRSVQEFDRMAELSGPRVRILEQAVNNDWFAGGDEYIEQRAQQSLEQWRGIAAGAFRGLLRYEYAQTMDSMGNIPRRNALMIQALDIHPDLSQRQEFAQDVVHFGLDRDPLFLEVFRRSGGSHTLLQEIRNRLSNASTRAN